PKDLKTRFDSRFCRMNCQMTVSRLTDARASIWHSAQRRSRELSLWPEFGSISGNLCDLSEAYFAATFLSSNPTTSASQSRLCGPCPARSVRRYSCSARRDSHPFARTLTDDVRVASSAFWRKAPAVRLVSFEIFATAVAHARGRIVGLPPLGPYHNGYSPRW